MALGVSDPKERQNNPSLWSEHAIRKPKVLPVLCSHFASSKLNTRPLEQNTEDARTGALSSSHTKHTQGVLNYFSYNGNKRLKEAIAASLLLLKVAALTLHLEDPRDVMLPARAPSAPALLLPLDTNLLLHSSRHNNWKWFLPQPKWKFASSGLQCNEDKKKPFPEHPSYNLPEVPGVEMPLLPKWEGKQESTPQGEDMWGKRSSKCRNLGWKDEETRALVEQGQDVLQDRHPATAEMEWKRREKALNYPCMKSGAEAAGMCAQVGFRAGLTEKMEKKCSHYF